ncbi:MAG: DNA-binding protein WhiA [Oscillospiraceae bacterium]
MTFCAQCKQDITETKLENSCCVSAQLYGMLLFCKSFSRTQILLTSEHEFVTARFVNLLTEFGIQQTSILQSKTVRDNIVEIDDEKVIDKLFADFGYSGDEFSLRIKDSNFICENCVGSFLAGCFLSGGTITDPKSGYHLEFTTYKSNLLNDLFTLLNDEGFEPRTASRGFGRIIYYKNSTQIEDLLTYMGAVNSSLELMAAKVYKDVKNRINRRVNCESANIDKTVEASAKDLAAIQYITDLKGDSYLSDELLEIAKLRIENPELSMTDLGLLLRKQLTKSGVSHRLRKIREEAAKLKQEHENGNKKQ